VTRYYRKAVKRDGNEPEIVAALEAAGADVHVADFTDLVVGFRGETRLLEVKDPNAVKGGKDKKQLEKQLKMMEGWNGGPWLVVETPEEALAAIGAI
jgi:hypothetical protein